MYIASSHWNSSLFYHSFFRFLLCFFVSCLWYWIHNPFFSISYFAVSFLPSYVACAFFYFLFHIWNIVFCIPFSLLRIFIFVFYFFFCCMFYSLSLERIPDSFSIFSIRCPFRSDLLKKKENKQTNKQIKGNRQTEFSSNPFVLFASRGSVNLASLPRRWPLVASGIGKKIKTGIIPAFEHFSLPYCNSFFFSPFPLSLLCCQS